MTNEEAKNLINKMSRVSKAKEAARIANAAIEKQIPKGLTIQAGVYPEMGTYICPNCGRLFCYVKYGTEGIENAEINYSLSLALLQLNIHLPFYPFPSTHSSITLGHFEYQLFYLILSPQ